MIIFDQLRISDDGTKLYVEVHVNGADYFKNIYIDKIYVYTADKVSETDPNTPVIETDESTNTSKAVDYIYAEQVDGEVKEKSWVLKASDCIKSWKTDAKEMKFTQKEMGQSLLFVYIVCKGTVGECTPCRLDDKTTLGVTFDEKLLWQRAMGYAKALGDGCDVPVGFVDFILLWNAFKASVETEHYIAARKYWAMLFDKDSDGYIAEAGGGCGCHG